MRLPPRARPPVAGLLAGGMSLLAACGTSGSGATGTTPRTADASTTSLVSGLSTTVAPTTTTRRPTGPVTLAFGGDVHFEGPLRSALLANPSTVLSSIAPVLRSADIAMVNLETAITERGTPAPKQFTFRAPAQALTALTDAGIDVATEANNHGVDYGPEGLADSLAARASSPGVRVIGIGKDVDDAFAPYRATVHGTRVAIIAATQVLDDSVIAAWTATDHHGGLASAKDVPRLLAVVRAARATNDAVVVYLHWGVEGASCPTAVQRTLATQLVTAGADVIVGSHSHRLEGAGFLHAGGQQALVDYGLGNFAFYTGTSSGVLTVTITGRHVDGYAWTPATISGGRPFPLSGAAASQATAAWNSLRACTDLDP